MNFGSLHTIELKVRERGTSLVLTTATQPRAGMLSEMALRWLKSFEARFFSLNCWMAWMLWEIGVSSCCSWAAAGALLAAASSRNFLWFLQKHFHRQTKTKTITGIKKIFWDTQNIKKEKSKHFELTGKPAWQGRRELLRRIQFWSTPPGRRRKAPRGSHQMQRETRSWLQRFRLRINPHKSIQQTTSNSHHQSACKRSCSSTTRQFLRTTFLM